MATRAASIWRSVIQPGSSTLRPKSPKASWLPRHAFPVMRPRCCLRYFTFFGINIKSALSSQPSALSEKLERASLLRFAFLGRQNFAFVDPALHPDDAVGGAGFGETVVNVGAQRVQRQPTLQIPFRTRDFVAIQAATDPDLDALAAETQCRIDRLAHGAAEADTLFELQCNRFRNQLGIEFRLVHFLNIDVDLAPGALLHVPFELVDLGPLASDNDARTRCLDDDPQLVAGTLDFNRTHARRLELVFQ